MSLTLSLAFGLMSNVSIAMHNPYLDKFINQNENDLFQEKQLPISDDEDEASDEETTNAAMLEFRQACIRKAEIGEQLALKKMHGTPLHTILDHIADSHQDPQSEGRDLPWHIILELQRIARDAYRENYTSSGDIDAFVMDLYHHCLDSGW